MRLAKPWYWEARGAWYVQINGKRIRLHENEREATRVYRRLMAAELRNDGAPQAPTVAEAIVSIMAAKSGYRESTRRLYAYHLQPFCDRFGTRRLDGIKPEEVIAFVRGYRGAGQAGKTYSDATRYMTFRFLLTLFRWARDSGLIPANKFAGMPNPWRSAHLPREREMSKDEYRTLMDSPRVMPPLKFVIELVYRTGARPGEVAAITARSLDALLPIIRLAPADHKTGDRTGLHREIVVPEDLMARLRALAKHQPAGPLLRRRNGNAWDQDLISNYFLRARRRLGLPDGLVLHMARHACATNLLAEGVPVSIAARLLGHTNTATIQRTYYHPETYALIEAVEKTTGTGKVDIEKLRKEVEVARRDFRLIDGAPEAGTGTNGRSAS